MDDQDHSAEVCTGETRPLPCLNRLPLELLFRIVELALAVGRERDVSALARTNKTMHSVVNPELYKRVIKHHMFYIAHWAAEENRMGTLKIAFANGADPNQMRTLFHEAFDGRQTFRPIVSTSFIGTDSELDSLVYCQAVRLAKLMRGPAESTQWDQVWFSSASLSTASFAHMRLLLKHYLERRTHNPNNAEQSRHEDDDARIVDLPKPLDKNFTFPDNMSPADMDRRDVKIAFMQLFQLWDTPLHIAALHNRVSVTKTLLAHGADVDCTATDVCRCARFERPTSGMSVDEGNLVAAHTPLHVAICEANFGVAKVLVASGAERLTLMFTGNDDREWLSENPLHRALSHHSGHGFSYNFIEFLLDHGYAARIEERNHEDMTPLLLALRTIGDPAARLDLVELLLRYGADPNNPGPSPPDDEELYMDGDEEWAAPALWAIRDKSFRLAELLLEHGADATARSSIRHETMLHAACTTGSWVPERHRLELLDTLLASDAAKELNVFDANDRTILMNLIKFEIYDDAWKNTGDLLSKFFRAGADIMAGAEMGKETPFERMITDFFGVWCQSKTPMTGCYHYRSPAEIGNMMWVILQASNVNQNPYRPRAMLNQFWGHVKRELHNWFDGPEIVPYMLLALIRAGFGPAEVDRNGDTAMTSFLQQLLDEPRWGIFDHTALCSTTPHARVLPMIMALLQEHDAALHKRNHMGLSAFDYLEKIFSYDGEDADLARLRSSMRRSVRSGLDAHGVRCFKFHDMELFGGLSGDDTLQRIRNNPSRWLVCNGFCGLPHCSRPA